jgi:hypothetical protein
MLTRGPEKVDRKRWREPLFLPKSIRREVERTHQQPPEFRSLRAEYTATIEPARLLAAEALQLEYRLHDLVNEAYGLTPEEVRLMWDTAPPRMTIPRLASV